MNDRNQALALLPACPQPATPTRLERTFDLPQPVQATLLSGPTYELRAES